MIGLDRFTGSSYPGLAACSRQRRRRPSRKRRLVGCGSSQGGSPLPNLKVYRVALVVAAVIIVIALFTLRGPETPRLGDKPVSFDGERAAADMRDLAEQFPQRVAGSDPDNRSALWVVEQFEKIGLETHIQGFPATVAGEDRALQNVWAVSKGTQTGTILLVANRDVSSLATQGANDNASGVGALLELARSFTVAAHDHSIVFLCTSGDAYGALGSRRFAEDQYLGDVVAVIALDQLATRNPTGIAVDGWSSSPRAAPPWLWLLTAPAARVNATEALLPGPWTQLLRLAAPASAGSQAPFVAAGVPGITLSVAGDATSPQLDSIEAISSETLTRAGTMAQTVIMAIDGANQPGESSDGATFLTHKRILSSTALVVILGALLLPLLAVTLDLLAQCSRARISLRSALMRNALRLLPWLLLVGIVYLANLVGLLPKTPDAVIPPTSDLAASPHYLQVALLLVLLMAAFAYAAAVERRLERRVAIDPRATVLVAHAGLVLIAVLVLFINPYSLVLVIPAALLWPLARPGNWTRSILPSYLGLVLIPVVLVYYDLYFGLGAKAWWYFFLLFENRTIPVSVAVLGVFFLSSAGVLARALHARSRESGPSADAAATGGNEQPARYVPRSRRGRQDPAGS